MLPFLGTIVKFQTFVWYFSNITNTNANKKWQMLFLKEVKRKAPHVAGHYTHIKLTIVYPISNTQAAVPRGSWVPKLRYILEYLGSVEKLHFPAPPPPPLQQ